MNSDSFIQFAKLDAEYHKLETLRVRLLKEQEKITNETEQIKSEIAQKNTIAHNLKKEIDLAQLDLKAVDTELSDKKFRLDNASSTKEYFSLETEIEKIKELRNKEENKLLEFWSQMEQAQHDLDKIANSGSKQIEQSENDLKAINRQLILLDADIEKIKESLSLQEKNLDPEFLDLYRAMKAQVTNPLAQVKNNSCSVCFYNISSQDLSKIRSQKLTRCKDCFRILFEAA